MKQFKIKIEKINRKWVELKVQSKKDNANWYQAKVLKNNLLSVIPSVDTTNEYDIYGNMETISDRFKTEHIFEICAIAYLKSSNETINESFTALMLEQSVANLRAFREVYVDETCYDEEIAEISNEIAEKYFEDFKREHKQGRNWSNGWFNEETVDIIQNVCLVHDYDDYIEKVRRTSAEYTFSSIVIAYEKENCIRSNYVSRLKEIDCYDKYSSKIEEMKVDIETRKQQEKLKAEPKNTFWNINKKIGEVFEKNGHYYRVTNITETCSIYDDDGAIVSDCRYNYARSIEFNSMNYEYHYEYHNKYEVEEISEEEFKSTKEAVQDTKETEENKETLTTEKLMSLITYIHHETTLITEDTSLSELETNNVCFKFSSYKIILAKNKIFIVELEANINLLESSHIYDSNNFYYRGYETNYQSKFLENLKEFFELTRSTSTISIIDTAIANKEKVEYMQTEKNGAEKSLEEATKIIKNTMDDIKNSYIQLGSVLAQVRDEEIYKQKYSTFADYCANELDMKKSQAYNYIKVFQLYGNSDKLNDYSFSQLNLLARKNKSVDEIVNNYPATLSKRELEEKLKSENVHPGGKTKKVKNISFDENETQLVLKALELLKSQDTDININSLIEKLGGK